MHHEGQQHTGHAEPDADGSARAQLSKLYFGRLDGSGTPRALTGGVCYCCKTAVAAGPDGSLFAAWRHVYPGNIRDIAFTVSRDGGRTFAAPRPGQRRPLGPRRLPRERTGDGRRRRQPSAHGVADARQRIGAGSEPTLALFYAVSSDGRQFTPRERIPTEGLPRHPQIAIDARASVVAAWDEQVKGTRRVVIGRAIVNGRGRRGSRARSSPPPERVYPAVAAVADGVVVAWTNGPPEGSVIRVARVLAPWSAGR